ncbi:MAG: hypothetical protein K8R17_06965 [Methanosarcinales archaeon]|nr:hypothetical protein [Methanosarcinales archaeon]
MAAKSICPKVMYEGYENALYIFEQFLNGYAHQYLNEKDSILFDKLHNEEHKEFCEIFGPGNIGPSEVGEFLDYFMIRKVIGSKELMKTVGRVIRKFVKWMNEKGHMPEDEFETTAEIVDELKDELPKVRELSGLIYCYIQDNPIDDFTEIVDGYFRVTKIEPRQLWLEGYVGSIGSVGPVSVSTEITSMCKIGWVINLELGKTGKSWKMLECGNVYPS